MTRHKSETDRAVFIQARFFLTVERIVATQDLIGHTYRRCRNFWAINHNLRRKWAM